MTFLSKKCRSSKKNIESFQKENPFTEKTYRQGKIRTLACTISGVEEVEDEKEEKEFCGT